MSKYSKAIGALFGTLTPAVVIAIVEAAGGNLPDALAVAIVTFLGTVGAYLAPKNTES